MAPIRVHLGPMPKMLRTFIEDLLALEADILIVGHSDDRNGLMSAFRDSADMLITQVANQSQENSLDAILAAAPIKIFAIGADGHDASLVDVSRQPVTLADDSQPVLGEAIRRAMQNIDPRAGGRADG